MDYLGAWDNGSFSADVFAAEAVLYMRLSGLTTLPHYYQATAFATGVGLKQPHAALLIDARKALLAISEAEIMAAPLTQIPRWRPIAFLVPHEHEEMFKRLVWKRAQQGLERLVFTSGRAAISWGQGVAARARVRAAIQAEEAIRLASPPVFVPSAPAAL
jgi:hypothetical protein